MPVRAHTLAGLILAYTLSVPAVGRADDAAATPSPPAVADSVLPIAATPGPVMNVRGAYEAAYAQRHAGDPMSAIGTAEAALLQIEVALSEDPDASTRRDLVDLRAKLNGLRDAAEADLQTPERKVEPGNEPDERVLNAPAADGIRPQYNAQVYKWIEFFCGSGRPVFERWLRRSGRYMHLFRSVLQREGLPGDLVHLVFVESGFNVNARSHSAAVGPWQFLRSTGRIFGLTVNQWVDERRDPEKSTVAAARYLRHLYSIFGDWPLALASYNAGEGAVLRAIKIQGTTNYWDLKLPRQTEEYVPQFMACLAISRDPHRYGFDSVELDDPMEFDEVAFRGAVDLRTIAKLADCSYDELRILNPAVLSSAARGTDGITTLRVPASKGQSLMRKLEEGGKLPAVNLTIKHRVKRGETLQQIANHYGVSARELARVNGVGRQHPLRRGSTLTVPASLAGPSPAVLASNDPRASTDYVPERKYALPASLDGHSEAEGRITVRVKRGETLKMIAQKNDCTVQDLMRWNRLSKPLVHRGQRLKIRVGERDTEAAARDSVEIAKLAHVRTTRHHRSHAGSSRSSHYAITVKNGDTLAAIARRTGVSVSQLKRVNKLNGNQVRSGQRLRVPRGSAG